MRVDLALILGLLGATAEHTHTYVHNARMGHSCSASDSAHMTSFVWVAKVGLHASLRQHMGSAQVCVDHALILGLLEARAVPHRDRALILLTAHLYSALVNLLTFTTRCVSYA